MQLLDSQSTLITPVRAADQFQHSYNTLLLRTEGAF